MLTEHELVNSAIGLLLAKGEVRVTLPGHGPLTIREWRQAVAGQCRASGMAVRFHPAACGCCAAIVWEEWGGDHGPVRLALDELERQIRWAALAEALDGVDLDDEESEDD